MPQSEKQYLRFMEDMDGRRYVCITDLMKALRVKMVGQAAGTFCDQLAAELHEAAEMALTKEAQ